MLAKRKNAVKKTPKVLKFRNIVYTKYESVNHVVDDSESSATHWMEVWAKRTSYHVFSLERCPDTGRLHYQGYMEFHGQVTRETIQRMSDSMWSEPRNRQPSEAADYAKKTASHIAGPWESGVISMDNGDALIKAKVSREEIYRRNVELSRAGKFDDLPFVDQWLHTRAYEYHRERASVKNDQPRIGAPWVYWIWGKTGVGKTRMSELFAERMGLDPLVDIWRAKRDPAINRIKNFDSFVGQKIATFDDFREEDLGFASLLYYLDRYPVDAPKRYKDHPWNPLYIFITSPFPVSGSFPNKRDDDNLDQLKRRLKEFHMSAIEFPTERGRLGATLVRIIKSDPPDTHRSGVTNAEILADVDEYFNSVD